MVAVGVTYTHARDLQRRRARRATLRLGEQLLMLTSGVIILAMALTYLGRVRAEAVGEGPKPVNLNAIAGADALEPVLATVFAYPADRRFAATRIAAYLR